MLNLGDFLLKPLYFVNQLSVFQVVGRGTVYSQRFILVFPNLDLILFLVDKFCKSLVFS